MTPRGCSASLSERLEAMERAKTERAGEQPPPWVEFPDYERFSLGWRMGGGEDFKRDFEQFFSALTEDQRQSYAAKHPEPVEWSGYYGQLLDAARNERSIECPISTHCEH